MKIKIRPPETRPSDVISLTSGWNCSLTANISTKKRWINRGLILGTALFCILVGLTILFIFDMLEGLEQLCLGIALILIILPFAEWAMRQKALMGTSIDIIDIKKEELLLLVEEFLRSRGYRYRPNQENFIIMKGEGFELDNSLRLTVFKVTPMHLSGGTPFRKKVKTTRLGIRNVDSTNLQTAIAIQIEMDKLFIKKGLAGSRPFPRSVVYRWNGKGYDTIV